MSIRSFNKDRAYLTKCAAEIMITETQKGYFIPVIPIKDSLKIGLIVCFVMAAIINTLFLLFVFVSKVVVIFVIYFVLAGLFLLEG